MQPFQLLVWKVEETQQTPLSGQIEQMMVKFWLRRNEHQNHCCCSDVVTQFTGAHITTSALTDVHLCALWCWLSDWVALVWFVLCRLVVYESHFQERGLFSKLQSSVQSVSVVYGLQQWRLNYCVWTASVLSTLTSIIQLELWPPTHTLQLSRRFLQTVSGNKIMSVKCKILQKIVGYITCRSRNDSASKV